MKKTGILFGGKFRRQAAFKIRRNAADLARDREHPEHCNNGEEEEYRRHERSFMSFTKGLPHVAENGLVRDGNDPVRFRKAIDRGKVAPFDRVPLGDRDSRGHLVWHFYDSGKNPRSPLALETLPDGDQHRRWESPTAGLVFSLEGPDAQAVTMPPAPALVDPADESRANPELVAELAEVYWLALLRDKHVGTLDGLSGTPEDADVRRAVQHLGSLDFYADNDPEHPRRRILAAEPGLSRQNVFRGHTPGDRRGPYVSQFMLMGSEHIDGTSHGAFSGFLPYGSLSVDLRVRTAKPRVDFMTHWHEWLDVQNGANVASVQQSQYVDPASRSPLPTRLITTLRDMATYVHFDALYEAYLNACLWLLASRAPFDPHFRSTLARTDHTEGFALFGGPHILTLVTEVATRGLKAIRFQKFNTHLRLRPEALAGLVSAHGTLGGRVDTRVGLLRAALDQTSGGTNLLQEVSRHNQKQNKDVAPYLQAQSGLAARDDLPLLPMAFAEGSPMHPSYGAGHATVAGACVTILKAFFDERACLVLREGMVRAVPRDEIASGDEKVALVPNEDGSGLINRGAELDDFLTVGDELNKLAANISIARNVAGVHYYSDYIDSLRLGEAVAKGILEEQALTYRRDPLQLSFVSFEGLRELI